MNDPTCDVTKPPESLFQRLASLLHLSPFGYLNCTQFLGAMNDNIFKLLIVFCFIQLHGHQASNTILASVGAIYVIPFLLLSSTAGTMADRFSKRTIIVFVKIVECTVMFLGLLSFYIGSLPLAYSALFLLACHSAVFAPCKYGIVPEIVPQEKISRANGILTFSTYSAIIVGTFLAAFLTDISNHNFMIASSASILFAITGLLFSLHIPKTPPSGSEKEINPRFISELFHNLKLIFKQPSLLSSVLGSAFFLFIGSYTQLNMIPFALDALGLTDVQGGYLFLLTALGIGAGSLLAGKLSGKSVELGLVPIGGFGIAICCIALSLFHSYVAIEIFLVALIGVFGGIYLVPLDSYIQLASPKMVRGQVIATTNFLGFFGVLCSAGMLYFLSQIVGLRPATGFLVMGLITLVFISGITIAIAGYVVRFIYMLISRFTYGSIVHGYSILQGHAPAFFLSTLPPWPWVTFLVGSQRRRMQIFIIKNGMRPLPVLKSFFYKLAFRHEVPTIDALQPNAKLGKLIRFSIERGTSVAIFLPSDQPQEIQKLKAMWQNHLPLAFFEYSQKDIHFPEGYPSLTHFEAKISQI